MTTPPDDPGGRRRTVNAGLFLAVVVMASVCLVGSVLAWQAFTERSEARDRSERYGAVLEAARAQTEAFINIDYRKAKESFAAVTEGATGKFKKQYDNSQDSVARVLKENKSVMKGEVLWAGVSALDQDSATVLVATSGTVSNNQTGNEPVARNFRLELQLEKVDGAWLTADLSFVGA